MQQVSDDDIAYAERLLFGRTGVFDAERIRFIKEMNICDLQAVPGSGKTTVLLAKLLIIEKYLPFTNGKSVLVISHTNAAVDEIKRKIGKHCPKLMTDPNFIGTMQSFVDKFLAIPMYVNHYKKRPVRIDDEIYAEKANTYNNTFLTGFTQQENNNAKRWLTANKCCATLRVAFEGGEYIISKKYQEPKATINKPRGNTRPGNYTDWTTSEKARVYEWIKEFKRNLFKRGTLCFDDAYFLAEEYIRKYPTIIPIIQKRFGYVFVDEMQDMSKIQYNLLEKLFWNNGVTESVFQRIGDKNQAIYDGEPSDTETWMDRALVLELNGSHRLSAVTAQIVQPLAFRTIIVNGLGTQADGSAIAIQPHLFVYTDATKEQVIPSFARTIKELQDEGKISRTPLHPFKAICWNTKKEAGKIRINDFHPTFDKEQQKEKVTLPTLENYLTGNIVNTKSFKKIQKQILNGLLRVLRMEGVSDPDQRPYSKRSLLKLLKEKHPADFETLQTSLFAWCGDILRGNTAGVLTAIRGYCPTLLTLFNKRVRHSSNFLNTAAQILPAQPATVNSNFTNYENIPIEVTTIHNAKGQTHTATLYLESFYQTTVGGGNYESERLAAPLKGGSIGANPHKYAIQSMRMAYVGFSRPTHLLCFAVHKERFDAKLADINPDVWKIIYL
jgi:DNA helicase II / ATP-dependent DNA helicase PcrA